MTTVPALCTIKKSNFAISFTFKHPTLKKSFRPDLNQREQLEQIHQVRNERKTRINWAEWTRTWCTHDCHLKILLALLGESQRVTSQYGCPDAARMKQIQNLAKRVQEDMEEEENEPYVQLLTEIASCGLFCFSPSEKRAAMSVARRADEHDVTEPHATGDSPSDASVPF